MRVCYFVQSHRSPAQVERLVRTLRRLSPDALVVVGHDARGCELDSDRLTSRWGARLLRSTTPVVRADLSALEPYLGACRWLAAERQSFDWLVLLSGQDYPLRPLAEIEAELAASPFDGYLDALDASAESTPAAVRRRAERRYGYRYLTPARWSRWPLLALRSLNSIQPWFHVYVTYGVQLGVRRRPSPFGPGLRCQIGWMWSTLSRACVDHLVDRLERDPALVEVYRRAISPEESLVQTVLCNAGRFRLSTDDRRFVDFRGAKDGRPRTLTEDDLPALLASGDHFARKFDLDVDSRVLDRLDSHLGLAG